MNDSLARLVGVAVLNGSKWYLRNRYGRMMVPKAVVAAGTVAIGGVVLIIGLNIKNR